LPRPRKRGAISSASNPSHAHHGDRPILKDKLAFTQSLEYRYVRTGSLRSTAPARYQARNLQFIHQLDWIINSKQSATASFAIYPQKLDYPGLNTFTPQPSTPDLHQRDHMASIQHRWVTGSESMLISQFSYKRLNADVTAQSDEPYRLLVRRPKAGTSTGSIATRIAPNGRKPISSLL